MSETAAVRFENLVPLTAGLTWISAGEGAFGFWFGALPGALLVAGGLGALLLPGDRRTPQLTALGVALAALFLLPMLAVAGFLATLGLAALAAASFVACGWAAHASEVPIERVPASPLDVTLAAKIALDQLALGALVVARPGYFGRKLVRSGRELVDLHAYLAASGQLEKPASYHREPPRLEQPFLRWDRSGTLAYERLSFESAYEPREGEPGRERWLSYARNREASAWILRHPGGPRPWLSCIHGLGMGIPPLDFAAFDARRLHLELGLNLAFPTLPLHGPRALGWRSGDGFLVHDFVDTIHAFAQAVWDVRRLHSWLRGEGANRIGVYGISLGGYTTALVSAFEAELAVAIAGIPAVDFVRVTQRLVSPTALEQLDKLGCHASLLRETFSVVSPLVLEPRLPRERLAIFAATADQLAPPDHARDLWKHWGEPRLAWYVGSHLSFLREEAVRHLVDDALRIGGLVGDGS